MHARRVRQSGESDRADRRPSRPPATSARRRPRASQGRTAATEFVATDDLRRTISAASSALLPGLGQLLNGRLRLAKWFALPPLVLIAFVGLRLATSSPVRLLASIISPTAIGILLALNVVLLVWRLASVLHAFFDRRYEARSGRSGAAGLALLLILVVVPHGIANAVGSSAQSAFSSVFNVTSGAGPGSDAASIVGGPGSSDRANILVIGLDATPPRAGALTDSLMVVSVDTVRKSMSLISIPGDVVKVPLGNGTVYSPKINSLMAYAVGHPAQFPQGGTRALEDAVGALLGIRIDYYARVDVSGFARLVDAVGGVDVNVAKPFTEATYDGADVVSPAGLPGSVVAAGRHHLSGSEALAYIRSRAASGESDFTRAARQLELLVALRVKVTADAGLLTRWPQLVDAFAALLQTDIPTDRLPDLAAVADETGSRSVYRMALGPPDLLPGSDPVLGAVQVPNLSRVQSDVALIAPSSGGVPVVPSTPTPTRAPAATKGPAATP